MINFTVGPVQTDEEIRKIGYEQMKEELGNAIKKFAKRQMTWFRRDSRIHWLDMAADPVAEACGLIDRFLSEE